MRRAVAHFELETSSGADNNTYFVFEPDANDEDGYFDVVDRNEEPWAPLYRSSRVGAQVQSLIQCFVHSNSDGA